MGEAFLLVLVAGVFAGMIAVIVLAKWSDGKQDRAAFERQFPPISDDEFLARCTPGTRPEVALKVRRMIAEYLAVEYERVHPSMRFVDDLGAD